MSQDQYFKALHREILAEIAEQNKEEAKAMGSRSKKRKRKKLYDDALLFGKPIVDPEDKWEDLGAVVMDSRAKAVLKQMQRQGWQVVEVLPDAGTVVAVRKLKCNFKTCPNNNSLQGSCKEPQKAILDEWGRCSVATMVLDEEDDDGPRA